MFRLSKWQLIGGAIAVFCCIAIIAFIIGGDESHILSDVRSQYERDLASSEDFALQKTNAYLVQITGNNAAISYTGSKEGVVTTLSADTLGALRTALSPVDIKWVTTFDPSGYRISFGSRSYHVATDGGMIFPVGARYARIDVAKDPIIAIQYIEQQLTPSSGGVSSILRVSSPVCTF